MEDTSVPKQGKSAPKRKIVAPTVIVTLVACCLLAVCAIAAPNYRGDAPVADGNYLHRHGSADAVPEKPAESLNAAVAVKSIKAGAKITRSDYKIQKQRKSNLDVTVEGKAWLAPDTGRLLGAVAKRDIPAGKIITSKDADLN